MNIGCSLLLAGLGLSQLGATPARRLEKANVLPLALDDAFQFRKQELFLNDPQFTKGGGPQALNFERQHVEFKAVTAAERAARRGHYFTFFWRTDRKSDVTIRLEYRQQNLGNYVVAQERDYEGVKGTQKSHFTVIGDDYLEDGRITSWRALMIEDGKVVALTQSYLWN